MPPLPLSLIVAHFIGDFILQSNWMALNKSKNWGALSIHVLAYMVPFTLWVMGTGQTDTLWPFLVFTALFHFGTDAVTSTITSKLWFLDTHEITPKHQEFLGENPITKVVDNGHCTVNLNYIVQLVTFDDAKRHWFFVMIGLDQLIHYVTLAYTFKWFLV